MFFEFKIKMELYTLNKYIFIYNSNLESNPGSVGRLGACLIHASLFLILLKKN